MKKLLIAIVALFVAYSAQAQIGVMAGLTSSKTNIETAFADVDNVNQFHVGVAYKFGLGNLINIQPAILYNVKGTKIDDIKGFDDIEFDAKTGYIEVPVQVQVGFGVGPVARVYGFAEPYIGYAITNRLESKTDLANSSVKTWDNIENRFTYGVGLGIGAEVLKSLQVSVKYFWDMGQVYDFNEITIGGITDNVKNKTCNGVTVSVAFFF